MFRLWRKVGLEIHNKCRDSPVARRGLFEAWHKKCARQCLPRIKIKEAEGRPWPSCDTWIVHSVSPKIVPAGSPSLGEDVVVYVFELNQQSLPTPFYSALVSISVFMALSAIFRSINSPDNSPFSPCFFFFFLFFRSYFCLIGPFNYISLWKSPSALI